MSFLRLLFAKRKRSNEAAVLSDGQACSDATPNGVYDSSLAHPILENSAKQTYGRYDPICNASISFLEAKDEASSPDADTQESYHVEPTLPEMSASVANFLAQPVRSPNGLHPASSSPLQANLSSGKDLQALPVVAHRALRKNPCLSASGIASHNKPLPDPPMEARVHSSPAAWRLEQQMRRPLSIVCELPISENVPDRLAGRRPLPQIPVMRTSRRTKLALAEQRLVNHRRGLHKAQSLQTFRLPDRHLEVADGSPDYIRLLPWPNNGDGGRPHYDYRAAHPPRLTRQYLSTSSLSSLTSTQAHGMRTPDFFDFSTGHRQDVSRASRSTTSDQLRPPKTPHRNAFYEQEQKVLELADQEAKTV